MKINKSNIFIAVIGILASICTGATPGYMVWGSEVKTVSEYYDFPGTGQKTDPYRIENAEDLIKLRDNVNLGKEYTGEYFEQTTNIDLSSVDNWEPIGILDSGHYFSGVYNGRGHTISNLRCVQDGEAGLFDTLGGSVLNLGIESGYIEGAVVGAIACHSTEEINKIINCYNLATLNGIYRAGGIVDDFSGSVIGCWNAGDITAQGLLGGIADYRAKVILGCTSVGHEIGPSYNEYIDGPVADIVECAVIDFADKNVNNLKTAFLTQSEEMVSPEELMLDICLSGNGQEKSPYVITDLHDLLVFKGLVNTIYTFDSQWVRQKSDIDLSEIENWTPIACENSHSVFNGIYDGDGHIIENINCVTDADAGFIGLLGGKVINLGINSGSISGGTIAGGIAAFSSGSSEVSIINCYNSADIYGKENAGGIAGTFSNGFISNCYNRGDIKGNISAAITTSTARKISNCYSTYNNIVDIGFDGTGKTSCFIEPSIQNISENLNANEFSLAKDTGFVHNNYYLWNEEGEFSNKQNFILPFTIRGIAISFCLLIGLLALLCLDKRHLAVYKQQISIKNRSTYTGYIRNLVFFMFLICNILLVGAILNRDTEILKAFTWPDTSDFFMDYFNPVNSVINNRWREEGFYTDIRGTYPPLLRFFFLVAGYFLPYDYRVLQAREMRNTSIVFMIGLIVFVGCLVVTVKILNKKFASLKHRKVYIAFLFLSSPFIYLFDRGNTVFFTLLLVTVFLCFYDSPSNFQRIVAYACLMAATAMKVYPIFFVPLILKDKKKKHVRDAIVLALIFGVVPFMLMGGVESLRLFIRNVFGIAGKNSIKVNYWLINYSNISSLLGKSLFKDINIGKQFANVTLPLITVILLAASLCFQEQWKSILAVTLVTITYPGMSGYYNVTYLVVPFMFFIAAEHKSKLDFAYAILLGITFVPLEFLCGTIGVTQAIRQETVGVVLFILTWLLAINGVVSLIIRFRKFTNNVTYRKFQGA